MRSSVTMARPCAIAARGSLRHERLAVKLDVPGPALAPEPHQVQQQLGAPRAHQAADAEHFAGTDLEVDAAQRHAALPGRIHVQAAHGQQRAPGVD